MFGQEAKRRIVMMHGRRRDGEKGERGFGHHGHGKVLGTATMGERGQIVIPAEAREALDAKAGDKFVVFGGNRGNAITLVSADVISKFADIFMSKSDKFEEMAEAIMSSINDNDESSGSTEADEDKDNADAP
jgi:AbrB family looped-hinge helix DNA binding protein